MKSEIEFIVNKLQLTENGTMVEVDTSILHTDKSKNEGMHRQYCNFVLYYEEYLRLRPKVGDCIRVDIKKIIPHSKRRRHDE